MCTPACVWLGYDTGWTALSLNDHFDKQSVNLDFSELGPASVPAAASSFLTNPLSQAF